MYDVTCSIALQKTAMIEEILAIAIGGILSEVFGTVLKQPVKRKFDEHDLQ